MMKGIVEFGVHQSIHKIHCKEMVNTVGQDLLTKSNHWLVTRFEVPSRLSGKEKAEPEKLESRGKIPRDLGIGNMRRNKQLMLAE
jgi:hypothetical protein